MSKMLTLQPLAATIVDKAVPKLPAPMNVTVLMCSLLYNYLCYCEIKHEKQNHFTVMLNELYKVLDKVTSACIAARYICNINMGNFVLE